MAYEPKHDRASIVILGQFNPAVFHPAWLARHTLIREEEAANPTNLLVTSDVTTFNADWLSLAVTQDRFVAQTDQPAYSRPLRDLVLGVFSLLEHTPFWAVGLNRELHYEVESEDQWHQYGHFLAPKEFWSGLLEKPGMRALSMWGERPDAPGARIEYKVEPSMRVHHGLFLALNEHRETKKPETAKSADGKDSKPATERSTPETRRELIEAIGKGWESAQAYARLVADAILDRGKNVSRS